MKKAAQEGEVAMLYGYLVCAKKVTSRSRAAVYVWALDCASPAQRLAADRLARKISSFLGSKRTVITDADTD